MSTDITDKVRDGLHAYAAAVEVSTPPVAQVRARAAAPVRTPRRRLILLAVPVVAVLGVGVAVANDGIPGVVHHDLAKAQTWAPAYAGLGQDARMVASDTAVDGTQVQEWLGTNTKTGASCAVDVMRRPGHGWTSTSIDCRIEARPEPTAPLVSWSASSESNTQTWLFRTGPATRSVLVHFSDGSTRTLDVSPQHYAMVVWASPLRVISAQALDANGRTLSELSGTIGPQPAKVSNLTSSAG